LLFRFLRLLTFGLLAKVQLQGFFYACLEMSFLTAGYLLGRQEYSKKKASK